MNFFPCKNLESMRNFYFGILNLPIALEQGTCLVFKVGESPHIAFWGFCSHYKDFLVNPSKVCLTLVVNTMVEVDRWYHYLCDNKIECIKKPAKTPQFRIYNAFFKDPMGYTLEIQSFYEENVLKYI